MVTTNQHETVSVKITRPACRFETVQVDMHAMVGGGGEGSIALSFGTGHVTGLHASFHGSVNEMRAFVAALNEHIAAIDAADAKAVAA